MSESHKSTTDTDSGRQQNEIIEKSHEEDGSEEIPNTQSKAPGELTTSGETNPRDHGATDGQSTRSLMSRVVLWLVLPGVFAYLVVYPAVELVLTLRSPEVSSGEIPEMSFGELIQLRAVQLFSGLWAFAFGASIGSFLNVLVYRQPRGVTVLTQPSRCPKCDTRLESQDNIPVIGWLRLGGHCRACDAPISSRYPIVEAITGCVFAAIVFLELTSGGANLPVRRINPYVGFVWTVYYPKWDLIALTLYHFHCFAMLLTWGLMSFDGVKIPWRSILVACAIGFVSPLAWNKLAVVPPGFVGTDTYPQDFAVVAASLFAGGFTGLVMAVVAAGCRLATVRTAAAAFVLLGVTLGWQATVAIGVVSIVISGCGFLIKRRPFNLVLTVAATAFVHHFCWRALYHYFLSEIVPLVWG